MKENVNIEESRVSEYLSDELITSYTIDKYGIVKVSTTAHKKNS
ncbi:hypothetical protein P4J13_25265 [Bacillus anthracis]|nr:hypothetical protein [Bacillus anthracis]MEB9507244.1 hypothetical protein [Bacillus anthracis]